MDEATKEKLDGWREMSRQQKESGLTIKEWCTRKGLSENSYHYRMKVLRNAALGGEREEGKEKGTEKDGTLFMKVAMPSALHSEGREPAALTVRIGGVTMEVADGAPAPVIALVREVILRAV